MSASNYLVHVTGTTASSLSLENCGLRGFSILVLDQENGKISLGMNRSTLAVLECFLSPRERAFPEITVTGHRNLLQCGVLAWKSDGCDSTLDSLDWQIGENAIGGLRDRFGRNSTLRQKPPASEATR